MITLPDLYCIFNRARGTEIVSPEDLLRAAEMMDGLYVGMSLRLFDSGVKVVLLDSFGEEQMCGRITQLLTSSTLTSQGQGHNYPFVQASDVSSHLAVSVTIAKEMLHIAETKGLLCRDEAPSGVYFYCNAFV
jgi:ESCRT-II complex subunit VPS36